MLNYEVDPSLVAALVPRGTELDRWSGHCYVSIVAFEFLNTRLRGIPIPFYSNFSEVNLRFYVRREAGSELRRGVVFVREIVPRRAVAMLARLLYNEPYIALPMRSELRTDARLGASYAWRLAGRWHSLAAEAPPPRTRPPDGSLEQFIAEHYWGYTRQRDGTTLEYHVTHPPWSVTPAATYQVDADLVATYGSGVASALRQPASVLLADGSQVSVSAPCPV